MDYEVILTIDAEQQLDAVIQYLVSEKKNQQAASSVLNDFEKTVEILSRLAGSLKYCSNPRLAELGYKKMLFQKHRYFLLFRLENHKAIVDGIFHELQDYENKIR